MLHKCVFLLSMVVASLSSRPGYIGCQTSFECGKAACCVVGMARFSIPKCVPRGDLGEECRPNSPYNEPHNLTLHYPDGVSVDLADVYYTVCPCQGGLTCTEDGGAFKCLDSVTTNDIYKYSEENNFEY